MHGEEAAKTELFDLGTDPSEKMNLAAEQPEKLRDMLAKLAEIAKSDRDSVVTR